MNYLDQADTPQSKAKQDTDSNLPANSIRADGTGKDEASSEPKIRKFQPSIYSKDDTVGLRKSWVGRLYVRHLKQIPIVRRLTIEIWRVAYPFYLNNIVNLFSQTADKNWYPIVKLRDYIAAEHITSTPILDAVEVDTPAPKVHPRNEQSYLISPHESYSFPSVYVARINCAHVYGGTNLIKCNNTIICHDLYNFRLDATSEELHGRHKLNRARTHIRVLRRNYLAARIPVAASFVDACAPNYAHWITEVLPRISVFVSEKKFDNIPIIVNEGLHKNIMESLLMVVGASREIILLPVGLSMDVDCLYVTSVVGYVPFERRKLKRENHSHGWFSASALMLLRNQIANSIEKLPAQAGPEKIYIRRNSGARKVLNNLEVEETLIALGYTIIEPEKMTFLQQFAVFSNAKVIVGSSGAAIANIIFTSINTRILVFIGRYEGTSYWYWQNMARSVQSHVSYIFGNVKDKSSGIHSDFMIDISSLAEFDKLEANV